MGLYFSSLVRIRESPEFSGIVNLDKSNWPRCLLWHGWLPALSGSTFGNPWAEDATRKARNQLEAALGSYVDAHRHPFDDFRLGERDFDVGDGPFVWSDGSLVVDKVSGVGVAGAGFVRIFRVLLGFIAGGRWICYLPCLMGEVRGVGCIVLSQVLFRQFRGLRFVGFGCTPLSDCFTCWSGQFECR